MGSRHQSSKTSKSETDDMAEASPYDYRMLAQVPRLPLREEAHIAAWRFYGAVAAEHGVWHTLQARLPQLRFELRSGISQSEAYRMATRRGVWPQDVASLPTLEQPLALQLYPSLGGLIPVLLTESVDDFRFLVCAFARRNEPADLPSSMGATFVAGYNNWDRVKQYQRKWLAEHPNGDWLEEFRRFTKDKANVQDRLIIARSGSYSGVRASDVDMEPSAWNAISLQIRLAHEGVHYFTRRVFGRIRSHPFDELLSDSFALLTVTGDLHADWLRRFFGIESWPTYRTGGRLENYVGRDSAEFNEQADTLNRAIEQLDRFFAKNRFDSFSAADRVNLLFAVAACTLPQLAARNANDRIQTHLDAVRQRVLHSSQHNIDG